MTEEDNSLNFYARIKEIENNLDSLKTIYVIEKNSKSIEEKQIEKLKQELKFVTNKKDIFQSELEREKNLTNKLNDQLDFLNADKAELLRELIDLKFKYETMSIFSFLKEKWDKWLTN